MPNVVREPASSDSNFTAFPPRGAVGLTSALINPLGCVLRARPLVLVFWIAGLGIAAIVLSYSIGVAWTTATVRFMFEDGTLGQPRTVWLGYLNHLHYGFWYAVAFPAVSALIAVIVILVERHTPAALLPSLSWKALSQVPSIAVIGSVLFYGAIAKNLWVERNDHKTLGLGWVQSLALADIASVVQTGEPYELKDRRFYPVDEAGTVRPTTGATVLAVAPRPFAVRSESGLVILVLLAKTLAATWEALLAYVGVLALFWGARVVKSVTTESLATDDRDYVVRWARRPLFYLFTIGLSAECFTLLRMCVNLQKGSFGTWDQLVGLGIHLPGVVAAGIAVCLFIRIHIADVELRDDDNIFSWQMLTIFTSWLSCGAVIARQLMFYFTPGSHELLVTLAALVGVKLG